MFLHNSVYHLSLSQQLVDGFWDRNQVNGAKVSERLLDKADEVLDDMGIEGFSDVADQGRHSEVLKKENTFVKYLWFWIL